MQKLENGKKGLQKCWLFLRISIGSNKKTFHLLIKGRVEDHSFSVTSLKKPSKKNKFSEDINFNAAILCLS